MRRAKFADTMIGSTDIKKTAHFYKSVLKMRLADKGDGSFVILHDPLTAQRLCIVSTPKASTNVGIGIETPNLDQTLESLKKSGCKVMGRWEYPKMIGANCKDIDGREMVLWQPTPQTGAKAKKPVKTAKSARK